MQGNEWKAVSQLCLQKVPGGIPDICMGKTFFSDPEKLQPVKVNSAADLDGPMG